MAAQARPFESIHAALEITREIEEAIRSLPPKTRNQITNNLESLLLLIEALEKGDNTVILVSPATHPA